MTQKAEPLPPFQVLPACGADPGLYVLHWLLDWQGEVTAGGQSYRGPVVERVRDMVQRPEAYGVSRQAAQAAAKRLLSQADPALEAEGGQRVWLAGPTKG